MARITDLPPEVLSMIFKELRFDGLRPNRVGFGTTEYWILERRRIAKRMHDRLVSIYSVCRTWQAVLRETKYPAVFEGGKYVIYGVGNKGFRFFVASDKNMEQVCRQKLREGRGSVKMRKIVRPTVGNWLLYRRMRSARQ